MPTETTKKKSVPKSASVRKSSAGVRRPLEEEVQAALAWLEEKSTEHDRENLARFGITASKAFGVSMANIQAAGEAPRAQPRARRRALGHRLVRGAPVDLVRRRAGARHARADGPLVPRLRQLGHLRHRLLPPVRPHAARLGQGRAVERRARRVRQARGLRAARQPRRARQERRRRAVSREPAPRSSAPPPTSETSSRRA